MIVGACSGQMTGDDRTHHLKEETLGDVHVGCEGGLDDLDVDGNDAAHDSRSANGSQHLCRDEQRATGRRQIARQHQSESNSRVEQSAANTVQCPGRDQQTKPVAERDEDDGLIGVAAAGRTFGSEADAHGVAQVGREEEEKGADELAGCGDKVLVWGGPVFGGVWFEEAEHGLAQAEAIAAFGDDGFHCGGGHVVGWRGGHE
jgi:hypothetical protein